MALQGHRALQCRVDTSQRAAQFASVGLAKAAAEIALLVGLANERRSWESTLQSLQRPADWMLAALCPKTLLAVLAKLCELPADCCPVPLPFAEVEKARGCETVGVVIL
jgi:hypothetical protein